MTEQEWLECNDPEAMLDYLKQRSSFEMGTYDRCLRLFACACCRRVWNQLQDSRSQQAVVMAERYADGLASREAMKVAWDAPEEAAWATNSALSGFLRAAATTAGDHGWSASWAAQVVTRAVADAAFPDDTQPEWRVAREEEGAYQARLLRDIFGNFFNPVQVDPAWLRWHKATVVHIAQGIYDGRRFQDLPILADALEEAGCTNPDILRHCRGPEEHVRGCWVVDLVLGKT